MNKNNLPNNLYELRKHHSLSQEEFAEKLLVSRQAVSKWERGEAYPDTENLIAISDMFSVTIDELLRGSINGSEGGEYTESLEESDSNSGENGKPKSTVKKSVYINVGRGIRVHCNSKGDVEDDDDEIDKDDFDDDDDEEDSTALSLWYALPYPIVITISFLLIGFLGGGWAWAWTLFITIPIYYSLADSVMKKRLSEFGAYPMLMSFIYLLIGMVWHVWHPTWLLFCTIPVYYSIADAVDKHLKNK